jgi:hypothetical protein
MKAKIFFMSLGIASHLFGSGSEFGLNQQNIRLSQFHIATYFLIHADERKEHTKVDKAAYQVQQHQKSYNYKKTPSLNRRPKVKLR